MLCILKMTPWKALVITTVKSSSRLTFELMRTAALTLLCSLHLLFWNQTLMTRESRPVISTSCSWAGSRGQCRKILRHPENKEMVSSISAPSIEEDTLCLVAIACWVMILTLSKASGLGLCWKQAVKMVRCFSVRTVLPRCDRPLPGPALLELPPLTL